MADDSTSIAAGADATLLPETARPEYRSKQDQVRALLDEAFSQAPPTPSQAPETAAETDPGAEMPGDLAALAERLGMAPDALYSVKLPMPDGREAVTIGQLKDAYRDAEAIERQREAVIQQRGEWHADQLRAQRELDQLLAAIPQDAVRPELRAAVEQVNRERISRETEALLRAVPEWSDPDAVRADLAAITAFVQPYGITAQDLHAVTDHRLLRLLRDQVRLAKKLQTTPAPPPVQRGQAPRKAATGDSPALQAGRLRQQVQTGRMRPADAVAALLTQRN